MKRCPICGHSNFNVTAHVTQGWLVDEDGDFIECTTECEEVTHKPNDDDSWTCAKCGHDAVGKEFNIPDDIESVDVHDVQNLIVSYQVELDLAYDTVQQVVEKFDLMSSICDTINLWLLENNVTTLTFGKDDSTTTKIVDIVAESLTY